MRGAKSRARFALRPFPASKEYHPRRQHVRTLGTRARHLIASTASCLKLASRCRLCVVCRVSCELTSLCPLPFRLASLDPDARLYAYAQHRIAYESNHLSSGHREPLRARGPKKHMSRLAAPKAWMLDKLGGLYSLHGGLLRPGYGGWVLIRFPRRRLRPEAVAGPAQAARVPPALGEPKRHSHPPPPDSPAYHASTAYTPAHTGGEGDESGVDELGHTLESRPRRASCVCRAVCVCWAGCYAGAGRGVRCVQVEMGAAWLTPRALFPSFRSSSATASSTP
jgi:hypothetical protein